MFKEVTLLLLLMTMVSCASKGLDDEDTAKLSWQDKIFCSKMTDN